MEAAQGWRLLLLHERTGAWRFVTLVPGDYWDDTGWKDHTDVEARWTADPASPLRLIVHWQGGGNREIDETALSQWGSEFRYAGPLPFTRPTVKRCFFIVRKGQVFSRLLKALAENIQQQLLSEEPTLSLQSDAALLSGRRALETDVRRLNSSLDPDHLIVDQQLLIPSPEQCRQLFEHANAPLSNPPRNPARP